jgi:hypothetical protein
MPCSKERLGSELECAAAAAACAGFSFANPASWSGVEMPASDSGATDSLLAGTAVGSWRLRQQLQ